MICIREDIKLGILIDVLKKRIIFKMMKIVMYVYKFVLYFYNRIWIVVYYWIIVL